ncbi:MAG: hypothetical protein IPJ26_13350 [Bacteroidetes bacterium]|nr:hypothetical protein [Bacteroidota bacterium]
MYSRKMMTIDPIYNNYMKGLIVKIIGGLGLAFVYTIYYPGGDTVQYFLDSLAYRSCSLLILSPIIQ